MLLSIPWLVLVGPGCLEFFLDPIDPIDPPPQRVVVHETFIQAPLPKADILLVIDDTPSMSQEQQALAADFAVLLDALDDAGVGWQVGVVSTEMNTPEAGWLRGAPYVLTPDIALRDLVFAEMVQVGVDGLGPEAGLAAATLALDLAAEGPGSGWPNGGFRRPDALLHVVFVSDADDDSGDWLGADPVASFLDTLADEQARTGLPARASGLVGPVPSGCVSASGAARAAQRYDAVVAGSGGVTVSICAADFAPVVAALSEASIVWQTTFVLRNAPVEATIAVLVDGVRVSNWTFDAASVAIVFDAAPAPGAVIEMSYFLAPEAR